MKLKLHALSVRHGQIEDGPYWCKLNTLNDEVITRKGFHGQEVVEYSVETSHAKEFADKVSALCPGPVSCDAVVMTQGGKPVIKLLSVDVDTARKAVA